MGHRVSLVVVARNESEPVLKATIDGLVDTSLGYAREIIMALW